MNKIEIKVDKKENGNFSTKIFIDGHKIENVRSFSLKQSIENPSPILTLDLNAMDLSIDSPIMDVKQVGMGGIKSIEFEDGIKLER